MEFRVTKTAEPAKGSIAHVALIDSEGAVEIHEELPADKAQERYRMLCLQVELNELEGKPGYHAYAGEEWPIPEPAE